MTNRAEKEVRAFFEELGLTVDAIPRARGVKTPDFLVTGDTLDYLVEVKAQGPSTERLEELAAKGTTTVEIRAATTGSLSSKLEHVERQLAAHEPGVTRLRVYAAYIDPRWTSGLFEQLRAALYGIRSGIDFDAGRAVAHDVYYADKAQFERYPGIDVVLAFTDDRGSTFVKEFSPRYEQVVASKIARLPHYDPRAEVAAGDAIACPIEWRGLPEGQLHARFYQERRMRLVQFTSYSSMLQIPTSAFESEP